MRLSNLSSYSSASIPLYFMDSHVSIIALFFFMSLRLTSRTNRCVIGFKFVSIFSFSAIYNNYSVRSGASSNCGADVIGQRKRTSFNIKVIFEKMKLCLLMIA